MPDDETLDPQAEQNDEALDEVEESDEQDDEAGLAEKSLEDTLKEVIDVRVEEVSGLSKKLTITVPHETVSEKLDDQYGELRRDAMVPGFRKGRAPRRLLEKRFGSEVSETLVQQLVGTGYMAAIDKMDLKIIGDPLIWAREKGAETETLMDASKAMELIELPAGEPLVFACEVEVRPDFALPEIEGIPLTRPVVTISDEDVTRQIERFRAMRGHYETLPDGEIQPDDVVIADVKMTSGGTLLKEQEAVRFAARPQTVDGVTLEKLGEVLTGAKAGDTRSISGTIPDDYIKAEFRGQQADIEMRIREVQRLRLPDLDESFIQGIGFESEAELRDFMRRELESRVQEQVHRAMTGQVHKYLLDHTDLELPERVSERQTQRLVLRRMLELYQQGVPPAETDKLLDELKTSAREEVARDLKLSFIMEKLGEEFEVDVSESEINGLIATIAQRQGRRFDRVRDELAREGGLMHLYVQIRDEKIVDRLIAQAKVSESKGGAEAAAKAASGEEKPRPKRKPPASSKGKDDEFADET